MISSMPGERLLYEMRMRTPLCRHARGEREEHAEVRPDLDRIAAAGTAMELNGAGRSPSTGRRQADARLTA